MEKKPITRDGYERLRAELAFLCRFVRPQVINDLLQARSFGYTANNLQYFAARERQAFVEGRIEDLRRKLSLSQIVVNQQLSSVAVAFGDTVQVENLDTGQRAIYQVVGPFESDAFDGRISIDSPLGRTLLGRRVGDEITVYAPGGVRGYRIIAIFPC
ncbi:MAG: transcription elongation factor GreA [Deltaproteobacteria bacterium]|nr:transcription elongation factor GreA [Deltaproteobacteria bacterium]MBW2070033.1 transcription elongation factor GreA [Deltaproteobacteria bacterium]